MMTADNYAVLNWFHTMLKWLLLSCVSDRAIVFGGYTSATDINSCWFM